MERYFETFFRHKWLFVVILLVVPALGVGYATRQPKLYQATATVWAEKPPYLDTAGDWNVYLSAAQNQATSVSEVLNTDVFDLQVLSQTDLRNDTTTIAGRTAAIQNLRARTKITPTGTHLITITYSDEQPKAAAEVVSAIISAFGAQSLANANSGGDVALSFYQTQLDEANAKLASATAALSAYLSAHPELIQTSADKQPLALGSPTLAAEHPDLAKVLQDRDNAAKAQQDMQTQVEQIRFKQSSIIVGANQTFRVMDTPKVPTKAVSRVKALILPIGASLGAALGFTAGGLILLTIVDNTVRTGRSAAARFRVPVVTSIPLLPERRSRLSRRRRRHDVRTILVLHARRVGLQLVEASGQPIHVV